MAKDVVSPSIERERLLARLAFARTSVIALIAPAGYGKSWLARAFARRSRASLVLACATLETEEQVASALLDRLGSNPLHGFSATHRETAKGGLVERAFAAWNSLAGHTVAIIDNVETASPNVQSFLARLIEARPESAVLLLSSRTPLARSISGILPPQVALTLGVDDLRFNEAEIAAVFPQSSPKRLRAIAALTEGWPEALFALERLGRTRELPDIIPPTDPRLRDLREYIYLEIVTPLPSNLRPVLAACCVIPAPTELDIAAAMGALNSDFGELDALTRQLPLVHYDVNLKIVLHPLLHASLLEHEGEGHEVHILTSARNLSESGKHLAAARLLMAKGFVKPMVHELEQVGRHIFVEPSTEYWSLIAALDPAHARTSPSVWMASLAIRRYVEDPHVLADEAKMLATSVATGARGIRATIWRANTLADLGRLDEALAIFDEFGREPNLSLTAQDLDVADLSRATILSRLGHFNETVDLVQTIRTRPREVEHFLINLPFTLLPEIRMARCRGDWEIEYSLLGQFLTGARASKRFNMLGMALAEAAFGAWLADEEDILEAYAMMLEVFLQDHSMPGFEALSAAFQQRFEGTAPRFELPRWSCVRHLVCCANAVCPSAAAAQDALFAACESGEPFLQVLCQIAVAELVAERRSSALVEARRLAAQIESKPLCVLLDDLIENRAAEGGFLAAFIRRLRAAAKPDQRPAAAEVGPPIVVEFLCGRVSRAGRILPVSTGGLALLVTLAIEAKSLSRESLCERLWPAPYEEASQNALKMCIHRTRRQLGDSSAIAWDIEGYSLGTGVETDVDQIQARVRHVVSRKSQLQDTDREYFLSIVQQLAAGRNARLVGHTWFDPVEPRLTALADNIGSLLVKDILRANDPNLAIAVANKLLAIDACDESALKVAIRAYMNKGDRTRAIKAFRTYETALKTEHDLEPSRDVKALLAN